MDIKEIINGASANDTINALKEKSVVVPEWGNLAKEYDVEKHEIMDTRKYLDKATPTGIEKISRVTLGMERLAVKRMTGLAFGIPVQRVYTPENDQEKRAAKIMEDIFQRNRIDSLNISRSNLLYASCEVATIWYLQEQPTQYAGEATKLKARVRVYSPMKGDKLYPLFDEYDDMVALSVEYNRTIGDKTITYFDTYTNNMHIRWERENSAYVEVLRENITLLKIPGVYVYRPTPIWENQSRNREEIEMKMSKQGNYIDKNSKPNWVIYSNNDIAIGGEENSAPMSARNVLHYGQNDRAEYATWDGANDATKNYVDFLEKHFFMELQLPDFSFENMKTVQMSGEARKMMFIDAQIKVLEESGIWLEAFSREINVIKSLMKSMYPSLATAIENLKVESKITPYQISDEKEHISNLVTAGGGKAIMSQKTAIELAGYVDDAERELQQIQAESDAMNLFDQEPTI